MNTLTKIGLAAASILTASKLVSAGGDEEPAMISVVEGSFSTTPSTCPATGECTITASATWQNTGGEGAFTPVFIIDGITHPSPDAVTLLTGQTTVYSVTVVVDSLADSHQVCPLPNP